MQRAGDRREKPPLPAVKGILEFGVLKEISLDPPVSFFLLAAEKGGSVERMHRATPLQFRCNRNRTPFGIWADGVRSERASVVRACAGSSAI